MKHFIVAFMIGVPFLLSAQMRTIEVIVTDTVQREVDFIICEVQIDREYGYYGGEWAEEEAVEEVAEEWEEAVEAVEEVATEEEYVYESYEEKVAKLQAYVQEHRYEFVNPFAGDILENYSRRDAFYIKVKSINEFKAIQRDIASYSNVDLHEIQFKILAEYDRELAKKLIKKANEEATIIAEVMGKSLGGIVELSEVDNNGNDAFETFLLSIANIGYSNSLPSYFRSYLPGVYTKTFKVKYELK